MGCLLWRMVDGDESGGAAHHLGRQCDGRALGTGVIGAGIFSLGTSDVGALVGHGALAVAATVGHGVAVLVGARDAWFQMLTVPLLLIEVRGLRREIGGPELHRHVVEAHWEVVTRDGVVALPPVLERRRSSPVIK